MGRCTQRGCTRQLRRGGRPHRGAHQFKPSLPSAAGRFDPYATFEVQPDAARVDCWHATHRVVIVGLNDAPPGVSVEDELRKINDLICRWFRVGVPS